jgi:hypothetical protein
MEGLRGGTLARIVSRSLRIVLLSISAELRHREQLVQ